MTALTIYAAIGIAFCGHFVRDADEPWSVGIGRVLLACVCLAAWPIAATVAALWRVGERVR